MATSLFSHPRGGVHPAPELTPCVAGVSGGNPQGDPSPPTASGGAANARFRRIECGTWPNNCVQRAFVAGAKWWQYDSTGATAFSSEVDAMEEEAVARYGRPRRWRYGGWMFWWHVLTTAAGWVLGMLAWKWLS